MKLKSQILFIVLILISTEIFAGVEVKWSNAVSEIIDPIKLESKGLSGIGSDIIDITYKALNNCRELFVFAKSMSSDGVELGKASASHVNVSKGDKFRDSFFLNTSAKYHIILEDVSCF